MNVASHAFPALGTTAVVATADGEHLSEVERAVTRELALIDAACSRFRPDSELSLVNASAGRWVAIGDVLAAALGAALDAAVATAGLVDPTVGASLLALGYRRDFFGSPPSPGPVLRTCAAGRFREIELDVAGARVRVPEGVSLDLGATAKALAADRAARAAAAVAGGVLVSLGGDISVAGTSPESGWVVHVTDDHRSDVDGPGQRIAIGGGGLATSSTTVRRWQRGGTDVHHIVDPTSGAPALQVWRTVSVAAGSCLLANVATTASIVLGEGAPAWLRARGLAARLVRPRGAIVTTGGWPVAQ